MKYAQAILCTITAVALVVLSVQCVSALDESPAPVDIGGTLTNAYGEPIPNAMVNLKINGGADSTQRQSVSDKDGRFSIHAVPPGPTDIAFEAQGYSRIEERNVTLVDKMDLSRTLQEKSEGGWWALLLLIPGVLGLGIAAVKDRLQRGAASAEQPENRFFVALLSGLIWGGVFAWWQAGLGSQGINKLHLFHPSLAFNFYTPILGFIGALLFVLDLSRKGREDIPKGTEFGMRLIMGPYVAIVLVVLFGQDLGVVDLTSPIPKAVVAFLGGLLAVLALQGLIERGQERLGQWRQRSRYAPSEVAKQFDLSQEEDLTLRKAGILHLMQLRERKEQDLQDEVAKVGFDPHLAVGLKWESEKEGLKEAMGDLIWKRLEGVGLKTIEGLALLDDGKLDEIAASEPVIGTGVLKGFRDQAKSCVLRKTFVTNDHHSIHPEQPPEE